MFCPKKVECMADIKENQMTQGTAAYLRCIDANGNSCLVSPQSITNFQYEFKSFGVSGGESTTWCPLGSYVLENYAPVRLNMVVGSYYIESKRTICDVTFTKGSGEIVCASGNGGGLIGYVFSGNRLNIYAKVDPTVICIGWIFGGQKQSLSKTTTEPSGIVYVA